VDYTGVVSVSQPQRKVMHLQKGTKAPQAAGRIHTDFEKGFIMAEVMKYADLREAGNEAAVKVH
jgi:obg-like ATPase 1